MKRKKKEKQFYYVFFFTLYSVLLLFIIEICVKFKRRFNKEGGSGIPRIVQDCLNFRVGPKFVFDLSSPIVYKCTVTGPNQFLYKKLKCLSFINIKFNFYMQYKINIIKPTSLLAAIICFLRLFNRYQMNIIEGILKYIIFLYIPT